VGGLCVAGLVGTTALPAVAPGLVEPPPFGTVEAGVQRLSVSAESGAGLQFDAPIALATGWTAPIVGDLRDGFGPRLQRPVAGVSLIHRGQDIGASCGEPVLAASSGTVVQAGWFGAYGYWALIDHGNGITTGYAHNGSLSVRVGQQVSTGQVIALAGNTGASSGCHLHLEARARGVATDPLTFMATRGVQLGS
jgi:murein DD-endopeptidase MepM/ murein hydrolase activator NlpD